MRKSAAWILCACVGCATSQRDAPTSRAGYEQRAAHARLAWEQAKDAERLAQSRHSAGRATDDEVAATVGARLVAEVELEILDLDVEEIRATGRAPQRQMDAPRVGDRDFVLAWLKIEELYAEQIRENLAARHAAAQARHESGRVGIEEALPRECAAEVARAEHRRWRELAALRQRITATGIDSEDAYQSWCEIVVGTAVEMARVRERSAARMLKLVQAYHATGLRTSSDVTAAQLALTRAQNEVHEARMGRGYELDLAHDRVRRGERPQ